MLGSYLRLYLAAAALAVFWPRASFADDFTTSDRYGGHVSDGFVFNNNRWGEPIDNGSLTIKTSSTLFTYSTTHTANNACCSAPYAGIGTIGGGGKDWTSDQYGLPGSHLPIKLQDIEALKGSWRFKVPYPTSNKDQYHIYYELFICDNTKGIRGKGNIAIGIWDNQFYHQDYKNGKFGTREDVGGYPMDVQFSANPYGQGDFWIVESPTGAHVPDASGVVTLTAFDIKKVIDWGIAKGTYDPQNYLTELNLAFEVMTLPGKTLGTEHASFCVKAKGADVVYTPTWMADEWGPDCGASSSVADAGGEPPADADAGTSPPSMDAAEAIVGTSDASSHASSPNVVPPASTASTEPASSSSGGCSCTLGASPAAFGGAYALAALTLALIVRRVGAACSRGAIGIPQEEEREEVSMSLKILQAGLGGWGRNWAVNVLKGAADVRLVGVVDSSPEATAAFRKEVPVPESACFSSIDAALEAVESDAVLVTANLAGHVPLATAALRANKHVLLEKPFAPTLDDAAGLVRLAEEHHRVLMISQNYRFFPAVRAVMDLVEQNQLGHMGTVSVDFRRYANVAPVETHRHYHIAHPLLMDMTIHHLDLMRAVLRQEPAEVACKAFNTPWSRFRDPATAFATITFDRGTVVSYRGSWTSTGPETHWAGEWHMEGELGGVSWTSRSGKPESGERVTIKMLGEAEKSMELPALVRVDRAECLATFVRAIQTGTEPEASGRDNLGSLALMAAMIESASRGQPVRPARPT
jgi:predicted dehydrogenase